MADYTQKLKYSTIFWWVGDCMKIGHQTCMGVANWIKKYKVIICK